ncbi:putative necrosis-inducing factor-domain-containing protein [Podospora aff. communis PSN243]|uniref:Necrosis-inducing factor-domain-containing protein n=1 Tax=Podospora aff. communis PSN243 TaxID=3040156 RepID=A0AAV9H4H0_9PEZI|nr:putative necrosis-inducing factor-domain-containing protein [Podospora aff. communis PSN243]
MKFTNIALALASLLTAGSCAPTPSSTTDNPADLVKRQLTSDKKNNVICRRYEYENKSSPASPLVDDCFRMIDGQTAGYYALNFGQQVTILRHGTCAFSAKLLTFGDGAIPGTGVPLPYGGIGDEDVRIVVRKSVEQFRWFDKIGARGLIYCDEQSIVEFGIYHT